MEIHASARWQAALAVAALVTLVVCQSASAAPPKLELVGDNALAVSAKSGSDEATTYLTVFNAGPEAATLTATFESATSSTVGVKSVKHPTIKPGTHVRVTVVLDRLKPLRKPLSGQLVIDGGSKPMSRAATIAPAPQPLTDWALAIMLTSVATILGLMVAISLWATMHDKGAMLRKAAPGPKWSFESWATTSTAVGAIVGTVLGSTLLPAVPRQIAKDSLVGLNLVFAALVVVAPFLFQAIRKASPSDGSHNADQERGLWGYNWALALACSVTAGAVLGEMATLSLVGSELTSGTAWAYILLPTLLALALLALRYFFVTARELATTDWPELAKDDQAAGAAAGSGQLLGTAGSSSEGPTEGGGQVVVPRRVWSLP